MTGFQDPLSDLGPATRSCLRAGLPGAAPEEVTLDGLSVELREVIAEGLAPVALKLLAQVGNSETASSIRSSLKDQTRLQQVRALTADALLRDLCDLFDSAKIEFVVVKGPAVARFHPKGWPRPYNDIDILVKPRTFGQSMDLLLEHHFTYPTTSLPPWSWFDVYCREGLNLIGSGNVDLHHHLAPWVFGARLRSIDVMSDGEHVTLGDRTVLMASPEHSAVVAALHILNDLWKGQRGLVSWRDLLVLLHQLEFSRVWRTFQASGLGWMLDVIVSDLRRHFPDLVDNIPCISARMPFHCAWRLRGLGWDRSTAVSRHRLAWAVRLPIPHAFAFVVGSGLPSPTYIRTRHGTYRKYWRQAWDETLSTVAGGDHRRQKAPDRGTHSKNIKGF